MTTRWPPSAVAAMRADLERRIALIEHKLVELERSQAVLNTGIALARWFTPTVISVAAVVVAIVRGG